MKRILSLFFGLFTFAALMNAAAVYQITVDTSSIGNSTPGYIEFQFNQANAGTSLAATATVSNFTSNGFTFNTLADQWLGGAIGSLSSLPVVFDNTGGASNLYDAGVSQFGSGFSFLLTLDGPALNTPATDGSRFFVYLLDSDYNGLINDGEGIAGVTINGDNTFTANSMSGFSTVVPYSPGDPGGDPGDVPEPSAFVLLGTGVAMLVAGRRKWSART